MRAAHGGRSTKRATTNSFAKDWNKDVAQARSEKVTTVGVGSWWVC
jgi:hypothetical protein